MSLIRVHPMRAGLFKLAAVLAAFVLLAAFIDVALAQGSPFGVARPPAAAPPAPAPDGIVGWLLAQQAKFYRGLSGLIRAAKADGSPAWPLLALSFLYRVFHSPRPPPAP